MFSPKCLLLLGLLIAVLLDPIYGRKGSHSYPKAGGLSGGGRSGGSSGGGHGYPSGGYPSTGTVHKAPSSGGSHTYPTSGSHGYPSGGGLSGGGSGYPSTGTVQKAPSSGGSHTYPTSGSPGYPSGGLSGSGSGYPSSGTAHKTPSSGGSHTYPNSGGTYTKPTSGGSHTYPKPGNTHSYPSGGLSGSGSPSKPRTTNVYNHYNYNPPQQIRYTPVGGGPAVSYPVYRGQPPTYVYQYKDSGSKYGTLLAGLALMNLGTLGVAAYALHNSNSHGGSSSAPVYKAQPGEVCKFAVKKENGDYEETRIDCQIISGFILQEQANQPNINTATGTNSTVITTTTVTNITTLNMPNAVPAQTTTAQPVKLIYEMLPNGTLVPVNVTSNATPNAAPNATIASNGTVTSSVTVTTTTTNSTLVNALDVKGKPVDVTPGMQCFIIRKSSISNMKKSVPCGVLQTYAEKSIQRNSATSHAPMFTVVAAIVAYCVAY